MGLVVGHCLWLVLGLDYIGVGLYLEAAPWINPELSIRIFTNTVLENIANFIQGLILGLILSLELFLAGNKTISGNSIVSWTVDFG
ncbi:MAG: hypothetical protein ACOYLO_00075 [Ferruginibacter sp.]